MITRKPPLSDYLNVGLANLAATSRTVIDGTIDISSAESHIPESCRVVFQQHSLNTIPVLCKEEFEKLNLNVSQLRDLQHSNEKAQALDCANLCKLSKDEIKNIVLRNYKDCMIFAYNQSNHKPLFTDVSQIKDFLITTANMLGKDIINTTQLFRKHDSDKFPVYTRVANLDEAINNFCLEFFTRINLLVNITDDALRKDEAITLAGWIEYRVNLTDHFIADGCGKTAAVLANFVYMAARIDPKYLPVINRKDYFSQESRPLTRRGCHSSQEKDELEKWLQHYRTAFFKKPLTRSNAIVELERLSFKR